MPAHHPKELRNRALALYMAGIMPDAISQDLSVNRRTLGQWIRRGKWRQTKDVTHGKLEREGRKLPVAAIKLAVARTNGHSAHGEAIRTRLADVIDKSVEVLIKTPIKDACELGNTPAKQGRATVIKTLVDAAATVFDWAGTKAGGIVTVGLLRNSSPDDTQLSPIVDVQAIRANNQTALEPEKPKEPEQPA